MGIGNEQSFRILQCCEIVQKVWTRFPLTGPEDIFYSGPKSVDA